MIKVFALIPKRPDITDEVFHEHWRNPHGELAKEIATIRRYVQSHRIGDLPGLPHSPYEGVAEVWFDNLATAVAMGEDPNYTDYAQKDEPNFIDVPNLAFVFTDEDVLLPGQPVAEDAGGAKALLLLKRAKGLEVEDFRERLRAAGSRLRRGTADLTRYVQCSVLPDTYGEIEPAYDAVAELWWPDSAAAERAWGEGGERFLDELGEAVDLRASSGLLAEEYRVIWP